MATQNFAIVKTRGFHLQNPNGLFVPYGSVLMMADVSGGQVIASRDLSLNSIEVSNRRLTVDASGNIRARSITLKDTAETGETTVVETNGGSVSVRDANILVSGEYDVSGNPTSGFVQTVGVKLTDISSESIPVTVLYKDTQQDLVWDGSGTEVLLDAGGIEDISTGVVNISHGIRSLAVDASANGLRLPAGPSDSARMYTCLTALLDIFNSRGIFISYGTAQPPNSFLTTSETFPVGSSCQCIVYGNGRWVSGWSIDDTNETVVKYSDDDGDTWTDCTSTDGYLFQNPAGSYGVCYGIGFNGTDRWVAVGNDSNQHRNIIYSDDGITWSHSPGTHFYLYTDSFDGYGICVLYFDGRWIVGGLSLAGNSILFSDDNGITWTIVYTDGFEVCRSLTVNPESGLLLGVGNSGTGSGKSYYSNTNGFSWTQVSGNQGGGRTCVYGNNVWVSAGSAGFTGPLYITSDPVTVEWSTDSIIVPQENYSINYIIFADGIFLAGGFYDNETNERIYFLIESADGITWREYATNLSINIYSIANGNSKWIVGGYDNTESGKNLLVNTIV